MNLPASFFKNEEPKEAVYRISANSAIVENTITMVIIPLATAAYTTVAVFLKIFQYDIRLSAILLCFIPVQLLLAFIFGRINFSLNERASLLETELVERLAEIISHVPLAKAFAKEDKEEERGKEYTQRIYKLAVKSSWLDQLQSISDSGLALLQALIISIAGLALLGSGSLRPRAWISFFMFSSVFNGAISDLLIYYTTSKPTLSRPAIV